MIESGDDGQDAALLDLSLYPVQSHLVAQLWAA
jgi:hypothetical protein